MYSGPNGGMARAEMHAGLMNALSHPTRLLILNAIRAHELSVGQLCEVCRLNQSVISQHLSRLRDQGIVKTRREHQMIFYRLASEDAERLLVTLSDIQFHN
ncbi:winged helix-turn-helix transcriptional regulator [Rhizobium sp. P38BS-XIX]|uniref:ArsR/SmtB family transcription factor n=1 Tax=Rhizobium sp. P38BS-XIX TaxID=2726740 RepID=UPI001456B362|nr:metalloregulator ArsR/SmtB family transcription factor [Rhizobium sp. P38BS-XIX]NLR97463.1 winged helix-turn-helix transcriptional regulator [Rhizobium sp. P38BS-XIX]